jgi:hypothetical protein
MYVWLISLLWIIFFLVRFRRGTRLTTEERVGLWLLIILTTTGVIFQVMQWANLTPTFLIPYTPFFLLLLTFAFAVLFGFLVGRLTKKPQPARSGTVPTGLQVYTREELQSEHPLEAFLTQAKQKVVFVGTSLILTQVGQIDTVKRLITERGIRFTFLLLSPDSELVPRIEADLKWPKFRGHIEQTLANLCNLQEQLKADHQEDRLEILEYDRMPTIGMIILDPETDHATIQIGTYVHGTDASMRLHVLWHQTDRDDIAKKYLAEYELFLSRSKPHECPSIDHSFGATMQRLADSARV